MTTLAYPLITALALLPQAARAQSSTGTTTTPAAEAAPATPLATSAAASAAAAATGADYTSISELPPVTVQADSLTAIRGTGPTRNGAVSTHFTHEAIESLPQGLNASLNQVLLQAPGVVQDSYGAFHIRGDHDGVQYRLNGVTLPAGISGFGQVLDARDMESFSLLTGTLPAQYGYRTGGVIDIALRDGTKHPGSEISVYGGSHGLFQASLSTAGAARGWEWFITGTGLRTNQGVENPTSSNTAIHDNSVQIRGLAYLAKQLDDTTRLSMIFGLSNQSFQIPNTAGLTPQYTAYGISSYPSRNLTGRQSEHNDYAVVSLNKTLGAADFQLSGFVRYSSLHYVPDAIGDLIYNGVASDVQRRSFSTGIQGDMHWHVSSTHTFSSGISIIGERAQAIARNTVLPLDEDGNAIDSPMLLQDRSARTGMIYGLYAQDEWKFAPKWTLTYGLRADAVQQYVHDGQISPRVNLVWQPTPRTTLHAGYARYFTPPDMELLATSTLANYVNTTNAPTSLVNGKVKPERQHSFDIGITQRFGERLTLGVDAYYKIIRDMIDLGQFGNALVYTPFNYQRGRVMGVEFTGNWHGRSVDLYGNLAISRAQASSVVSGQYNFDEDELAYIGSKNVRVDHDQLLTGSAGAVWRAWEGGRLSGTVLYGSGMRAGFANSEGLSPYATVNLGVTQDFGGRDGKAWTARFDIMNVADASYQLRDGSGIGVGAPQWGLRRSFYAGLSHRF